GRRAITHLLKIGALWQVEQDNGIPHDRLTGISPFGIEHIILYIDMVKFKWPTESRMLLHTQRDIFEIVKQLYFLTIGENTDIVFLAGCLPAVGPGMGCDVYHRIILGTVVGTVHVVRIRRLSPWRQQSFVIYRPDFIQITKSFSALYTPGVIVRIPQPLVMPDGFTFYGICQAQFGFEDLGKTRFTVHRMVGEIRWLCMQL